MEKSLEQVHGVKPKPVAGIKFQVHEALLRSHTRSNHKTKNRSRMDV
jgi:hypothetical protein